MKRVLERERIVRREEERVTEKEPEEPRPLEIGIWEVMVRRCW